MSTAIASLPPIVERHISPHQQQHQQFPSIAASSSSSAAAPHSSEREPAAKRARSNGSPASPRHSSLVERPNSTGKVSPTSATPLIKVKKEPGSPSMSSRPRPKRLDLSTSTSTARGPQTGQQSSRPSAPLTSRDSAGLAIQDVGLACLSPGFQTNDPGMREQLQRSLDVRDQQRQIIEARQKGAKPGSAHETDGAQQSQDTALFGVQTRTPSTSKRKGPPPGLSIAAPSAAQFANDRVIQSAPLNQTFTGLRPGDQAYTRHAQHGPSALSQTSHIHHVPATQTNNRLPPIADVFANDRLDVRQGYASNNSPSQQGNGLPPPASPGFATQIQQQQQGQGQGQGPPLSSRPREFRSAEEAMAGLSGGRDDLMPKVVHYGGVQPPTPPSPMLQGNNNHAQYATAAAGTGAGSHQSGPPSGYSDRDGPPRPDILARTSSMNGRRRGREEFERDNGSPPRTTTFQQRAAAQEAKRAAFATAVRSDDGDDMDWRSGMSGREKKEEFLRLCERAWDLFHS